MSNDYSDTARPLVVADEFNEVLSGASVLVGHVPELQRYLREFPLVDLSGAETFVYWPNEHLGFKPVISLTHVVTYRRANGAIPVAYVVSGDLYSSRSINASIGLKIAVGAHPDGPQGFTVIYVSPSRIDVLGGMLGGLKRWLVEKRARGEMEKRIRLTKATLEAPVQPFYHELESIPGRHATLSERERDSSRWSLQTAATTTVFGDLRWTDSVLRRSSTSFVRSGPSRNSGTRSKAWWRPPSTTSATSSSFQSTSRFNCSPWAM